jgi:hypothetical protein
MVSAAPSTREAMYCCPNASTSASVGRMISSRRAYTSSSGIAPFIAASVSRAISG